MLLKGSARNRLDQVIASARSEDAAKKPALRDAFRWGRCLIPGNGCCEWTKAEDGGINRHLIHLPESQLFGFAGLWARNEKLGLLSSTILTAAADPAIEHLHNRMPILLNTDVRDEWLDMDNVAVSDARKLLPHYRGADLTSYRVGRVVTSGRAEGLELIEPIQVGT